MSEYKLEPFDLDRAIAGDPMVYRTGEDVLSFHFFADASRGYKCIGVVISFKGINYLHAYTLEEAGYYLEMKAPVTPIPFDHEKLKEGWIVRQKNGIRVHQMVNFNAKSSKYHFVGVVNGMIKSWSENVNDIDSIYDLVMYPPVKTYNPCDKVSDLGLSDGSSKTCGHCGHEQRPVMSQWQCDQCWKMN